jgi:hypothetical protein
MLRDRNIWLVIPVCTLVGIFVVPAFLSRLDDTPATAKYKAQMDLDTFATLIEEFHARNHRYPRDDERLGPALSLGVGMDRTPDRRPQDPWGRPYVYRARADGPPQVYSIGPNGIDEDGKNDDISVPVK